MSSGPTQKETQVKDLQTLIVDGSALPSGWAGKAIIQEDNLCYLVWNQKTLEAILVDTCREDIVATQELLRSLPELKVVAVIDTHTHADHVTAGPYWSEKLGLPWIMHSLSPTRRAQVRIFSDTPWFTHAGPIQFVTTPGHTPDGFTIFWGPFIFTGDTVFYGDTGRDDLPGGDAEAHFDSLQKIKAHAKPEMLMLPGHDMRGGRISSWKTQLEVNASLTQPREIFVPEAAAFVAPSPKLLKESLFENFK
jgi:glyoxylase-like metal-dependent hydrolase (beta-lactamase superfamily II)